MLTSSPSLAVMDVPRLPNGTLATLKKVFDIHSYTEWILLWDCRRDGIRFGLDPRHMTHSQLPHFRALCEKEYIAYNLGTGLWELTIAGQGVVENAPLVCGQAESSHCKGKLLFFPT